MTFPKTVKKTARTQTVKCGNRLFHVTKKRCGKGSWNSGSQCFVNTWHWSCKELNLVNLTRLELEKELLNQSGFNLEVLIESFNEWSL